VAIDPESLRERWTDTVSNVLSVATLKRPANDWMQKGGRSGDHTEHLGHLLSELQSMQRTFPNATW
jgi:ring-1,2-phenylacetyl-CoA epoxidase subunit PaaC